MTFVPHSAQAGYDPAGGYFVQVSLEPKDVPAFNQLVRDQNIPAVVVKNP